MIKIGITQRVEVINSYNERRDCLDQAWSTLSEKIGILPIPIPNLLSNKEDFFATMDLSGFILTGGNDLSSIPKAKNSSIERDLTEQNIMTYATRRKLPILGICRGLQFINAYFGGKIIKVDKHRGLRHQVNIINDTPLSQISAEQMEVNSFHNLGLREFELGHSLKKMAIAHDNTIEGIFHESLPLIGIMWHPEREIVFNPIDIKLFQNLFRLI